jgi:hypothetical protein
MRRYEWHSGTGLALTLSRVHVEYMPRTGAADAFIAELRADPIIAGQLQSMAVADVVAYLQAFGAWSPEELAADHEANLDRVLWLAIGDCQENPDDYVCDYSAH